MERTEVYKLIDEERDYQDYRWSGDDVEPDSAHSVADWILYMENQLNKAKEMIYKLEPVLAMAQIRKVTALGVACMEYNDIPRRMK